MGSYLDRPLDWEQDSEAHDPDELEAAAAIYDRLVANEPTCDYGGEAIGSYCGSVDLVTVTTNRREARSLCARHLPLVLWDWFQQGDATVTVRPTRRLP